MKHFLTTAFLAIAAVSTAWAAPDGAQRLRKVATVPGDGTTIYGEVTYSGSMDDPNNPNAIAWGLYSFDAQSPITVSPISLHTTLCANGGGTYRKGKLYFTSYYEGFSGTLEYLYFIEMNLEDNSIERHALVPDTYDAIAVDMTYDPVGDKIYGVSFDSSDVNFLTYVFVEYNLTACYPTVISPIVSV